MSSDAPSAGPPAPVPSLPGLGSTWYRRVRRSGRFACAGRGLVVLAAPVLPVFAAWCVGWFAAALTVRAYPGEVGARRRLEAHNGQSSTS